MSGPIKPLSYIYTCRSLYITQAGAYHVPVPVPKLGFCSLGMGQVQTSAPYHICKCVPSLNLNSRVTQFWDEKSHLRNTPISWMKKVVPELHKILIE